MAYPPPPYADAVCGQYVCGEAICGAWWAYPTSATLRFDGTDPQIDAVNGDVPPPASLVLKGYAPKATVGYLLAVPAAKLSFGAVTPSFADIVVASAPQAGLVLGTSVPALKLDPTMVVPPAGLLLRAETLEYAGPNLLVGVSCEDADLEPVACEVPVLVGGSTSVSLEAASEPDLILLEVPARSVSLTGVES